MKNMTVGIFHDEELGRELGKPGTKSDILMFNRKTDDCIYSFMSPVDNKLTAKAEIMTTIDTAIISFKEMSKEIGETILMLDSIGIKDGIFICPYLPEEELMRYIEKTSLSNFRMVERDSNKILNALSEIDIKRKAGNPVVVVDHSFSVKGVGEVILGLVQQGTVKKHDKLFALPAGKEVVVRSIQMQDKDEEEAGPGSRVGLAIRGAKSEEMKRGTHICKKESVLMQKKISLNFRENKFYSFKNGRFHLTVGMQTLPVEVEKSGDKLTVVSDKEIVFTKDNCFLILDLNSKDMHLIGSANFSEI